MSKRLFDIVFSISGILFSLVPLTFAAILIKILMPGPIFFIQKRVGKDGRIFNLIKLRTMKSILGKPESNFEAGNTTRITPFGRFLRKTKFDEFPQLFNVLKGDMSIVGPRPEVEEWTRVYPEKWRIVHSIKPGISDNASIEFRNEEILLSQSKDPLKLYQEEILPKKLELYIDYINEHSLRGDIKIICKTITTVLFK